MSSRIDRERAYRIFNEALDVDPLRRAAFVGERCAGDVPLQHRIESLLAAAARSDTGALTYLGGTQGAARDLTGQLFGQFRLIELIGTGGMSEVYRAERSDGLPQGVAVKLLRGEITVSGAARFVSEARLLARLEHPAIARLIDAGIKDGERWLALELVRGRPIDEYCQSRGLGMRERVKLLAVVADAVAAAHRMLVVHRDIKPTNVLVSEDGRPKLIDFGIAAAISAADLPCEPSADICRLFTPNYAAPEQFSGEPVTVATDVFGLGALGHRLLTGRAPFAKAASPVAYMLAVTEQDADLPSHTAAAAGMDPAWVRELEGDLDAILTKALARDPARRYATAEQMQADLHRHLDGLPVNARNPTVRYRTVKLAHRLASALNLGGPRLRRRSKPGADERAAGGFGRRRSFAAAIIALAAVAGAAAVWRSAPRLFRPAAALRTAYDDDTAARDLYMNARFELSTRSADGLAAAERAFRLLTERYPNRAPAWSGLADTFLLLREFSSTRDEEAYPEAERDARKALELDPKLADAWADIGFISYWWDLDSERAFQAFDTALKIDSGDARINLWYANALCTHGDYDKSLALIKRARALDPADRAIVADEYWARFVAGDSFESVAELERMAHIDPKFAAWHRYLWRIYLVQGRDADALREAVTTAELRGLPDAAERYRAAAARLATGGRPAMLLELSSGEESAWTRGQGSAVAVAGYRALAHDRAAMMRWLSVADSRHDRDLLGLFSEPNFRQYRDDPEFLAIADRYR
jgi:serine/threonine protein kinase/Flp pilus assembly protein TadD